MAGFHVSPFFLSHPPLFTAFLAPHILAGLTGVVSGLIAMLSRKQKGRHSKAGTVYFWALGVAAFTASILAFLQWKEDGYLFFLGALSFALALLGRYSLHWRGWGPFRSHITGMGSSYIVMLIAFYMDNGKRLPIWKDLPDASYWLLPLGVGTPIIIWVLVRHPLVTGKKEKK